MSNHSALPAITPHESEVARVKGSGRQPVVFVHGRWLPPSSWDRSSEFFAAAGYAPLTPGCPDDPETVDEATAKAGVFADKTVGQVAANRGHALAIDSGWHEVADTAPAFVRRFAAPGGRARARGTPNAGIARCTS